jgi:ABC-type transport system involved in cytochrome c biogenesis permease subunit
MNAFSLAYLLLWAALAANLAGAISPARWLDPAAVVAEIAAWTALTFGLIARGLSAGHWPLTDRYEFALCFVWAIVGLYLIQRLLWRDGAADGGFSPAGGAGVIGMALLVATYALTRPAEERAIYPLLPALRSVWLQVHVLSAAIGYGACGVAAGLALPRVLRRHISEPDADNADRRIERTVAWAFPWLTLSILTGAIWAQAAWARYWSWDPKEAWALITWLWYLLVLHLRGVRGWQGRRLGLLVVAGFAVVLFAFAGLPWLIRTVRLTSLHGF